MAAVATVAVVVTVAVAVVLTVKMNLAVAVAVVLEMAGVVAVTMVCFVSGNRASTKKTGARDRGGCAGALFGERCFSKAQPSRILA